jgi:hypothetical protein
MTIDYDSIRYARDWRYGQLIAPHDRVGDLESVWWLAFPTAEDRAKYIEDVRFNQGHIDILSEQEIAVAIGANSREELWEYFELHDPEFERMFLHDRRVEIYGKADPRAQAPSRDRRI